MRVAHRLNVDALRGQHGPLIYGREITMTDTQTTTDTTPTTAVTVMLNGADLARILHNAAAAQS